MKLFKTCTLGVVLGTMAVTGLVQTAPVQAQGSSMSAATPMPVSGTVLRYYVDRAGFVSAMDVQTADGIKMVRFTPTLAQSLTTMYPVGSTANVFVTMSGNNVYLAGTGPNMPTPSAMYMPMTVTDLDVLKSEPYIMLGSKLMSYTGKLRGYIADPMVGDVVAIVIEQNDKKTLVRVPRENRLLGVGMASARSIPLTKNADVLVFGYPEAPRYGIVSPYADRVVATGITVDGKSLGPLGFGPMKKRKGDTLLGFDLNLGGFLGGNSPEEVQASRMGYSTYTTSVPTPTP